LRLPLTGGRKQPHNWRYIGEDNQDGSNTVTPSSTSPGARDKYDWAGKPSTDSAEVMRQYDEMAPAYDETLLSTWGYRAPAIAADLLTQYVDSDAAILDVGCGTGLTGGELQRAGFKAIDGVDISVQSLDYAAKKGIYRSLVRADLLEPLPFPNQAFGAALCVGVLSYITGDILFRELCRVVRKGGVLLLSHRTDLMVERSYRELLTRLEAQGLWSPVFESANLPYLPGHPDFGTGIEVQLFVLKVR
jgi:SAM-dependent methyltransferase